MQTLIANKYKILEEVGRGRASTVFRALNTENDEIVALKVLARQAVPGPKSLQYLEDKLKDRPQIEHPHATKIIDFGLHQDEIGFGTFYVALEFVEGENLKSYIARLHKNPITLGEILNLLLQVAEALSELHNNQIQVGTLEPERIRISHEQNIKLPAFGFFANQEWKIDGSRLSHMVMPNVKYVAPECISHDMVSEDGDLRTDIYLFGILAFELACGTVPFDAGSEMTLKLQKCEPVPQTLLKAGLPEWYDSFVKDCMQKEPGKRPDVDEVRAFLETQIKECADELHLVPRVFGGNDLKVLFIEDNKLDQLSLARFAKREPFTFNYTVANSIREAKIALKHQHYDVLVSDYMLPDGTGVDLISEAAPSPVIIVTGAGREDVAAEALRAGAFDYISKDVRHKYLAAIPGIVLKANRSNSVTQQEESARLNGKGVVKKLLDSLSNFKTASDSAKQNIDNRIELERSLRELERLCGETESLIRDELENLFEPLDVNQETCEGTDVVSERPGGTAKEV